MSAILMFPSFDRQFYPKQLAFHRSQLSIVLGVLTGDSSWCVCELNPILLLGGHRPDTVLFYCIVLIWTCSQMESSGLFLSTPALTLQIYRFRWCLCEQRGDLKISRHVTRPHVGSWVQRVLYPCSRLACCQTTRVLGEFVPLLSVMEAVCHGNKTAGALSCVLIGSETAVCRMKVHHRTD